MRGLSITLRETALSLTDSEAAQPLDIFWCVVAPATLVSTSQWQRPEPFAKPEPAGGYTEFIGAFAYREEWALLFFLKHVPILELGIYLIRSEIAGPLFRGTILA